MDIADYTAQDVVALARRIRDGDLTPGTVLDAATARLADVDPALGTICRRIDPPIAEGAPDALCFGVPFVMKDLGAPLAGVPTAQGCRHLADLARPEPRDGDLTRRYKAAGFVLLGKTTVPEFGLSLSSEPAAGPTCRNPWDRTRIAGGSSGGAAAAVAAGIVPAAHATDAGGSIRVPAACCGVFGLKPSRGLMPQGPDFGNFLMGLASEHVVTRTVRDSALILRLTAGNTRGPTAEPAVGDLALDPPPRGLDIGFIAGDDLDREWATALADTAAMLERFGHRLQPLPGDALTSLAQRAGGVVLDVIAAHLVATVDAMDPPPGEDGMEPLTWAVLRHGRALGSVGVVAAAQAMLAVGYEIAALFEDIDLLLCPMLSGPPPPLGAFPTDHDDLAAHGARLGAFAPYAGLFNVGGQPAMSLPCGLDSRDLPLAVQMAGPLGADRLLLRLAAQLEAARPWPLLAPVAEPAAVP